MFQFIDSSKFINEHTIISYRPVVLEKLFFSRIEPFL